MRRSRWKHFLRYQSPAILWAVTIYLLSSVPSGKIPRFPFLLSLDKLVHATIFFIFGLLIYRALEPRTPPDKVEWKRILITLLAVVLYGAADEFHQGFVPGRTVDVKDLLADTAGGLLSALAIYVTAKIRRRRRLQAY